MFEEEFTRVTAASQSKVNFLKTNPIGYFLSSMLAGAYIGIGIILIFTLGGYLSAAQSPVTKLVMGLSFGIALSLVIIAGADLFTGNVFVMTCGALRKKVSAGDAGLLLLTCYIGNLAGSVLTGFLYYLTGLAAGPVGEFIANTSAAKMSAPFSALFFRGVLCNILVCLAVWCGYRCKEETSKLIMVFWCLFAFISSGFEHSIANMTLLTIGLLAPGTAAVSIGGFAYNLLAVTLGNMAGAIFFLAIPYHLISGEKQKQTS